jgi:general secretion pathway protein L
MVAKSLSLTDLRIANLSTLPGGELIRRWRDTLIRCLPRPAKHWLAMRRPRLVVVPCGDDAELLRQVGAEREAIGSADLRTAGPLDLGIAGGGKQPWHETWIELPAADVLLRSVTLPVQVRGNLRQVVSYEIDRLTPFTLNDVYFDARIVGTVARGSKLDVALAVCRRDRVTDWLDRLREGRSPAAGIRWVDAWPNANLLPPADRPRRPRFAAIATGLLAALIVLLVAAILITPLWQKTQQEEALRRELRSVRIAAEEVEQVRDDLERARLGSVEVLQRKRGQPRMTDLLRELTDLLPDGTWVQTLNVRDGEVDLRGESTQATALIGLLEQGPGISQVTFRSPVMQVGGTGQERFHIAFTYSRPEAP